MKMKRVKHLTLGTLTALAVSISALSLPAFAQDVSPIKAGVNTVESSASTARIISFIRHVWRESPLVREAEARMNAARAQARADSKWRYNPEVEFEVEDKKGEERTKLAGISQTIDWNGKFLAARKVAKFELQAAIAERDDARQTIAVDILTALADYQAAHEILTLSIERTELMERFATLASKRFRAGDIDQSEYNLAQLAFSEALIRYAGAESALGEYRLALETPMGFSANNMPVLPTLPERLPEIGMNSDSVEQVIMRLPAIRILENRGKAARASIKLARRERLADPTLSLKGGQDEGANLIGVSLSIPLNIFNTYGSQVDVARYESAAQERSLQSAFHIATSRLDISRKNYELSSRAWKVWKKTGSRALEDQLDTLDIKFKVNELSSTDYLVQVEQTLDTRIAAQELHSKAWKAWFAWIKASGNVQQWLEGE